MDKVYELRKLYQEIFQCTKCHPKVFASKVPRQVLENTLNSEIMLMAQAPGECGVRISGVHWNKEDGTLTKGGIFLDKQLRQIGYSIDINNKTTNRPYTTNILQCWTGRIKDSKKKRDRNPDDAELVLCSNWWQKELEIIQPKIMLLLGAPATVYFVNLIGKKWKFSEMLRHQGEQIVLRGINLIVFGLPHPTAGYVEKGVPHPRKRGQIYQDVFEEIKETLNA